MVTIGMVIIIIIIKIIINFSALLMTSLMVQESVK